MMVTRRRGIAVTQGYPLNHSAVYNVPSPLIAPIGRWGSVLYPQNAERYIGEFSPDFPFHEVVAVGGGTRVVDFGVVAPMAA